MKEVVAERIVAAVLGHSHIGTIAEGVAGHAIAEPHAREPALDLHIFDVWRFEGNIPYMSKNDGGPRSFNPEIVASIADLCHDGDELHIFTTFGGNEHNALALVEIDHPVDVILDDELPQADAELIPRHYMQAVLASLSADYDDMLRGLRAAFPSNVHTLEPPPPIGDRDHIRANLDAFFRQSTETPTIAANQLRLKVWALQCRMQKALCEELGVNYLKSPSAARDDEGFLRSDCLGRDATHANSHYGSLVIESIEHATRSRLRHWSIFG